MMDEKAQMNLDKMIMDEGKVNFGNNHDRQ